MKKQIIRLGESDLHKIIKESVKAILNETKYPSDYTILEDEIELWNITMSDKLIEFLEDYDDKIYDTVSVAIEIFNAPYDSGDYLTPPYGGVDFNGCEIDTDGKFKAILPDNLYSEFKDAVYKYVYDNSTHYEEEVKRNNEWLEDNY